MNAIRRTLPVCAVPILLALNACGTILPHNHSPVIDAFRVNGVTVPQSTTGVPVVDVTKGSRVLVELRASDSDGDPLDYNWFGATASGDQPENFATYDAQSEGLFTITCSIKDDRDGVVSAGVSVRVVDPATNHPPTATLAPAQATVARGGQTTFSLTASDPDAGDTVTTQYFASRGSIAAAADQMSATYTAPATAGEDTVYAVVTDGHGTYVVAIAKVTVQ